MKTLYGIQYLRGLAAVAVVGFHAALRANGHFLIGEAGVDLFFVLSGFLMVAITTEETRPLRFLRDRVTRIVPAYWIATSVFLLGALIGVLPGVRLDLWHVASSYLFLPSRMPGMIEVWPLLVPGWTLNFEMFFYVLFAASLLAPRRFQLPIVTAVLAAQVALGALFHPTGAAASFYSQPILLEFVAGAWLGSHWKRHGARPVGPFAIATAILLYLMAGWANDDSWRALSYGVPALALLTGVLDIEQRGELPAWRPLKLVGDASYSIYLWHTMILSVFLKVANRTHLPAPAAIMLGLAAGIVGGIVAYHLIERPLLTYFKRRKSRQRAAVEGSVGR